jgi:ParB-like chromosome segregation protein Spo0J
MSEKRGRGQRQEPEALEGPQTRTVQQVEQIPVSDLIPYARNARTHSDAQVAQIAGSIQEFGFCNPVLIDKANGIIAGHGRVRAADLLKLQTVPCIRLDHLTDAQKRAYILADNRIALSSGWDEAMLANELQDLHADEIDLGLTGFDADELGKLLGLGESEGDEEADEGLTVGPVEYRVVVITQGESDQSQLITELEQRGYKCQPLMS